MTQTRDKKRWRQTNKTDIWSKRNWKEEKRENKKDVNKKVYVGAKSKGEKKWKNMTKNVETFKI